MNHLDSQTDFLNKQNCTASNKAQAVSLYKLITLNDYEGYYKSKFLSPELSKILLPQGNSFAKRLVLWSPKMRRHKMRVLNHNVP